jgi:hypothetical protein
MKRSIIAIVPVLLGLVIPPLSGLGEKVLSIGADAGWSTMERRSGVTEIRSVRSNPVMVLISAVSSAEEQESILDLSLSFDEGTPERFVDRTGHYRVQASSEGLLAADRRLARVGMGAALFSDMGIAGREALVVTPQSPEALLSPGMPIRDFSIEFWLFPTNIGNGEQILSFSSSTQDDRGGYSIQQIQCMASRNRLQWSFPGFFRSPAYQQRTVTIAGSSHLVPRVWSHHIIRFDSDTGLLEYLVNGQVEEIVYATSTGREGGQVYYPVIGDGSRLVLGGRFVGMLDEFRIYSRYALDTSIQKYPARGGWMESRAIDFQEPNTSVLRIDAFGGRTSSPGGVIRNEYAGSGPFSFPDDSTLQFFIRAANSPYDWPGYTSAPNVSLGQDRGFEDLRAGAWRRFIPGTELSGIEGRYVQLAVVFYPSGDGETTPYLDELRITYRPDEPPPPPSLLTAIPNDGSVELQWKPSAAADVQGYLVYYGTARGEYFGEGADLGASPIDVGKRTSVRINGLKNGTLYYFAVVAYDQVDPPHLGVFSRETSARPLP